MQNIVKRDNCEREETGTIKQQNKGMWDGSVGAVSAA